MRTVNASEERVRRGQGPFPDPELIRAVRRESGLTQKQAAALVHLSTPGRWSEYETGKTRMEFARFELFLLLLDRHPHLRTVAGTLSGELPPGCADMPFSTGLR